MAAPITSGNVVSKKGAVMIGGNHTDIVCTDFEDRLFVVITQYQKLGTLVHASRDVVLSESQGNPVYSTKVLLGKDELEIHAIARNLASNIPVHKPIMFALALKDTSPQTVHALKESLPEYKCW